MKTDWPRGPYRWIENRTLYISVPFSWNSGEVCAELRQPSFLWDRAVIGGPGVYMARDRYEGIANVTIGGDMPGILQRVNPLATRTTTGCMRKCGFCGIGTGKIEAGGMRELADWPDLPIICDNNLLAASEPHFDRVIDRLVKWKWADFNQGLDARLLTKRHAERIKEIRQPMVRLALDCNGVKGQWEEAFQTLRAAKIAKHSITSYCLVAFQDHPAEAWARCKWVESHGVKAMPMWFHELQATEPNIVTKDQEALGWNDKERTNLMGWFYKHRQPQL